MNDLDRKIIDEFPGKAVRKDLTALMKRGANVPTYVLEFLLGMYCATDDEDIIEEGCRKIRMILSENYVSPDQSEYIKSRIKENGVYTVIDNVSVKFIEKEEKYVIEFTNFKISPFEISSDFVVNNDKLLTGGIWCMLKIKYVGMDNDDDVLMFDDSFEAPKARGRGASKKSKYDSPFAIDSLRPIQMSSLDLDEIIDARNHFTKEEWITVVLRSAGYEPDELEENEKMHYLLRMVPLIQKNYNLVELGPKGTGKSHIYSELSPYSILMSNGTTTVSNMFCNMRTNTVGLVGNWDCIAFDEVAGMTQKTGDMIQIMKNYMANWTFARGSDTIFADASIAFEGNTFSSVQEMLRTTNLFDPFPDDFNNDSAFFDRIHAYLPGWETPKLREALFTKHYGLISDCLAEFYHEMRKRDYTDLYSRYFELNRYFNIRDTQAVSRTFSGLAKIIYPNGNMSKEEVREILEYAIECRRRVKEQLCKMDPEFSAIQLGYKDLDTGEEIIIEVPETAGGTLIYDGLEKPGYVYGVGMSIENRVAIYRLENKLLSNGSGSFSPKNVEGIAGSRKSVRDSLVAAFNYFKEKANARTSGAADEYDYTMYFNDMQNRGVSDEVSVAEVVALFSALSNSSVRPSTVICGRVVMSGTMMPVKAQLEEIFVTSENAGAETIFMPEDSREKCEALSDSIRNKMEIVYYKDPFDAAKKALNNQ